MEVDSQTKQGNADDNAASSNGEPPSPIVISSGDDTSEPDDFDEAIGPEFTEFNVPFDIATNNEDEDNQHAEIPTGLNDEVISFEFLNTEPQDMFFSSEYDYPTFGPYPFDGIEGMPQEENIADLPPSGMESVLELQDSLAIPMIPVPPSSTLDSNNLSYEQFLHAGDYQGGPSGDWDIFSGPSNDVLDPSMLSEKNVEANDIPKQSEVIEISSDEESDNSYYLEHVKGQNLKRSSSLMNGMDDQNQSSLPKRLRLQDFPAEASAPSENDEINHQDDSDAKE